MPLQWTKFFSAKENWKIFKTIIHRKQRTVFSSLHVNLNRTGGLDKHCKCLTKWDLSALGLGSCLSIGMFVLVGSIGMRTAGPAIVLSILFAAIASVLAALCHAEFGARAPQRKPFMYTYASVGPLPAFMVGWCNLLEGLFGTASVAKALSTYIDTMAEGKMSESLRQLVPLWSENRVIADYFDIFSILLIIAVGFILVKGAQESLAINNLVVFLNLIIVAIIVLVGSVYADALNWSIPDKEIPDGLGVGGFAPFGFWGIVKASALCFYAFVGFESHSISGEEIEYPQAQIPQVIFLILLIITIVFAGVTIVLTMMVPYFEIDQVAAVASAFGYVNIPILMWVVCIMAVTVILCSLFVFMFPLPRLLFAMATRGLMWKKFTKVTSRRVPYVGSIFITIVTAVLVGFVELEQLILWMCIGTLMMYTIVSANVIIVRYRSMAPAQSPGGFLQQMAGRGDKVSTVRSSSVVLGCLLMFNSTCVAMALLGILLDGVVMYVVVLVLHFLCLFLMIAIWRQPQNPLELTFKTPLVPFVPMLSIYMNIEMMILVDLYTCLRLGVWVIIGLIIYLICTRVYNTPVASSSTFKGLDKKPINQKPPTAVAQAIGHPQFTGQNVPTGEGPSNVSLRRNLSGGPLDMYPDAGTSSRQQNRSPESTHDEIISASILSEISTTLEQSEIIPAIRLNDISPASKQDEIIVQQDNTENNEDKEAKIIDLLDQVLQAEEDSYIELISLKEHEKSIDETMIPISESTIPHRKSLTELSDAGSDASFGNQELSKYSVIVQIHREDLPKLSELEEAIDKEDKINYNVDNQDEQTTAFNDSETNSRTDESGYSDTLDRNAFNDSVEDTRDIPYIPTPPPLDESFFITPYVFQKSYTIPRLNVQKSTEEQDVENKPRESIQSNNSQDDGNIVFGSNRQKKFMNKLNDLFQNKIASEDTGEEQRKRSNSTGAVAEVPIPENFTQERSKLFTDLKKELVVMHSAPNLRPVRNENKGKPEINIIVSDDGTEDTSLSREDLKSKLETLFASGGPNLLKPRLMKSNPLTPDDSYQSDLSSSESIPKIPKIEKNDTLKRQKDKFGEVLNSFRLSLNKDDEV